MRPAEAQMLAAKLAAAFPREWVGEATNAVYVEKLAALDRAAAASDAIESLIENETRLPPIALIREEYRRHFDRHSPPALEEPTVSDEERDQNIRRMKILSDHLSGESGHGGGFDTCSHPGCVELRTLSIPDEGQLSVSDDSQD